MIGDQGNTRAVRVIRGETVWRIGHKEAQEARKSDDGGCQRGRGARTQRKQESETGRNLQKGTAGTRGRRRRAEDGGLATKKRKNRVGMSEWHSGPHLHAARASLGHIT